MDAISGLLALGLNKTETKLYLALAQLGKASATYLAKNLQLPRTTIYSALGELAQKGLVSIEKQGRQTFYMCHKPEALLRHLETLQNQIEQKKDLAKEMAETLAPFFKNKNFNIPKLSFYDGEKAVRNMLYDYDKEWVKSMKKYDNIFWGYQDHTFVEIYRDWLDSYWQRNEGSHKINLLSNSSKIERKLYGKVPGRTIKFLPTELSFSSTLWVCGDYIILIVSRQKPFYAFQLNDAVFSANLRSLFSFIWELDILKSPA